MAGARRIEVPAEIPQHGWWDGRLEEPADLAHRAERVTSWVERKCEEDVEHICLVIHAGFGSQLMARLLGNRDAAFPLSNTGFTGIELNGDQRTARRLFHL